MGAFEQKGQLIAEIAKFGGMDKAKASQLATILLPHIENHTQQERVEAKITELENIHGWWTHGDNDLEPKNLLHRIKDLKATLQDKKEK